MIKLCEDDKEFFNICNKLKEVKKTKLTENNLYTYMVTGLHSNRAFTYVSYDNNNMNGCLVLFLTKDILGETTLGMIFTWIDAHYPKLHKEFIDIAIQKARELKAEKISITTNRNENIINRRIGKYGFTKACSVFEKRLEKEVV